MEQKYRTSWVSTTRAERRAARRKLSSSVPKFDRQTLPKRARSRW